MDPEQDAVLFRKAPGHLEQDFFSVHQLKKGIGQGIGAVVQDPQVLPPSPKYKEIIQAGDKQARCQKAFDKIIADGKSIYVLLGSQVKALYNTAFPEIKIGGLHNNFKISASGIERG